MTSQDYGKIHHPWAGLEWAFSRRPVVKSPKMAGSIWANFRTAARLVLRIGWPLVAGVGLGRIGLGGMTGSRALPGLANTEPALGSYCGFCSAGFGEVAGVELPVADVFVSSVFFFSSAFRRSNSACASALVT